MQGVMFCGNAGHAGVIQQLLRRGFHLDLADVDGIENLLMMSDQLHHVSTGHLSSESSIYDSTVESSQYYSMLIKLTVLRTGAFEMEVEVLEIV